MSAALLVLALALGASASRAPQAGAPAGLAEGRLQGEGERAADGTAGAGGTDATPDAAPGRDVGTPGRPAGSRPEPEPLERPSSSEPALEGPRFERRLTTPELRDAVQELVAAGAGRVTLESLGRDEAGASIPLLAVSDPGTGAPDEKPALLVLGRHAGDPTASAEATLALGWTCLTDAALGRALERATVYLAPLLEAERDPGGAEGGAPDGGGPEGGVRFERNFPCGWLPEALRPGSGRTPLSRPETLALARFLDEHPEVVLVAGRRPEPPALRTAAQRALPADVAALEGLARPGWSPPRLAAASPLDQAYFALGTFALGWPEDALLPAAVGPPSPAPVDGAPLAAPLDERVALHTRELAALVAALPRLRLEPSGTERLSGALWRLDLLVANDGGLPTASALASGLRPERELVLEVRGARVLAAAARAPDDPVFRLPPAGTASGGGPLVRLGSLGAGEARWIRLVLQAEPEAEIALEARGAWAGRARATARLP